MENLKFTTSFSHAFMEIENLKGDPVSFWTFRKNMPIKKHIINILQLFTSEKLFLT